MKKNLVMTFAIFGVFLIGLNTVSAQSWGDNPEESGYMKLALMEIEEIQEQVNEYTPESGNRLYTYKSDDWVLIAVSPRARDKWIQDMKWSEWRKAKPGNKFDAVLDALAASVSKKLPTTKVNIYNFRPSLAEEKMMKGELKNLATLKIFKIGLDQDWYIAKNDYGIPTSLYRYGVIWARDGADDHPYCHNYWVNLLRGYAGGGTYGATYATFVGKGLVGCPAGAK